MKPGPANRHARSVWAAPLVLGVLMSAGLIVALVGDGVWDALACLLLTGILAYAGLATRRHRS